jgi:hypothetical protein
MGKHFAAHGVSKYANTPYADFRVELPKDASVSAKALHGEVLKKLDQMQVVQKLAIDMLTVIDSVLRSDELLGRPKVKERLLACFAIKGLSLDDKPTWDPMISVFVRTRSGLERDRRVKFSRLTSEADESGLGGKKYGAVQPSNVEQLKKRGYLMADEKKKAVAYNQGKLDGLEFDEDDSEAFIKKTTDRWKDALDQANLEYKQALVRDEKFKATFTPGGAPDVFMGGIKLDMFTFIQRISGGEHELVARSMIHEGTHRHAATEDHAYMKPDGSGPKTEISDYTEKPITAANWLENADSYAHLAYWLWKEKKESGGFG